MILIAASLFGFALGCGVAVLREMLGRTFGRPGAAEEPEVAVEVELKAIADPPAVSDMPESAIVPVIAHMPSMRRAAAAVKFANAKPRPDISRIAMTGVSKTVDRILNMPDPGSPSTIVLLSPDNDNPGRDLSRDLADALYRQQKDVYFSTGESAEFGERAIAADLPLGNVLKFHRLSPITPRSAEQAAPTFRNFTGRHHRKADYVIIDARGQEARRHIEELLRQASGILVLANEGDEKKIDGFLSELAPFRDRMLGTIVFEPAA
jgi:hypothetical protein